MSERMFVGCGDNSCVFEKPRGAGTNGGCQCLKAHDLEGRRRLMMVAARMRVAEARWEALRSWLGYEWAHARLLPARPPGFEYGVTLEKMAVLEQEGER